ncbi:MAG: hypothetical protein PVI90_00465 [Desulfobacteraceae bacterium]|jgi:hypothetical protein
MSVISQEQPLPREALYSACAKIIGKSYPVLCCRLSLPDLLKQAAVDILIKDIAGIELAPERHLVRQALMRLRRIGEL